MIFTMQLTGQICKVTLYARIWCRTQQNHLYRNTHIGSEKSEHSVNELMKHNKLAIPEQEKDKTCPLRSRARYIACLIRWIPFWTVRRVMIPTTGVSICCNPSICCNAFFAALLPSTTFTDV